MCLGLDGSGEALASMVKRDDDKRGIFHQGHAGWLGVKRVLRDLARREVDVESGCEQAKAKAGVQGGGAEAMSWTILAGRSLVGEGEDCRWNPRRRAAEDSLRRRVG